MPTTGGSVNDSQYPGDGVWPGVHRPQHRLERALEEQVVGIEEDDQRRVHLGKPEVAAGSNRDPCRRPHNTRPGYGRYGHVRGVVDDEDLRLDRLGQSTVDGLDQRSPRVAVPSWDHDGDPLVLD